MFKEGVLQYGNHHIWAIKPPDYVTTIILIPLLQIIRCIELAFAALERPCVKRQMIYTSVMGVALQFTALRVCMCRDTERKPVCAYCRRAGESISRSMRNSLWSCVCEREMEREKGNAPFCCTTPREPGDAVWLLFQLRASAGTHMYGWSQSHTQTHTTDVSSLPLLAAGEIKEWER